MVYYYNPHTSLLKTFLVFKGTVWQCVLSKFEFWAYMGLQLAMSGVIIAQRGVYGDNEQCYAITSVELCTGAVYECSWVGGKCTAKQIDALFSIDWAPVKLGPPFMVFLIVFFLGNCYSRYMKLYKACMGIDESVKLFVQEQAICCNKPEVRKHIHLATKYIVSSVFAFYFGLTHGKVADEEWEFLTKKGLLDKEEVDFLKKFPGHRGLLLNSWALRVAAEMIRTKEISGIYSPPERGALFHRISTHATNVCQQMRMVADLLAMPIPFAYWHILNIVLGLNFAIVGYTLSVKTESILSSVPFAVFLFVFMGLRSLSATLADPFRESSKDPMGCAFPLVSFVNYTYDHAVLLLASIDHFDPHRRAGTDEAFFKAEQVSSSVSHQLMYFNSDEDGAKAGRQKPKHAENQREAQENRKRKSINTYLRGEQVNVAYKWDPAGLVKDNSFETYMSKWLTDNGLDKSVAGGAVAPVAAPDAAAGGPTPVAPATPPPAPTPPPAQPDPISAGNAAEQPDPSTDGGASGALERSPSGTLKPKAKGKAKVKAKASNA